jgi:tetratricopeptide (TPR) repeat protein
MVVGAAGVGKTRLVTEFSLEASEEGVLTLAGACYDRDDPLPFVPFVEMLEPMLAGSSLTDVREALGEDIAEIARLLPQLRRLFPDIPPPLELPPEQSRRVLFNAVARVLGRMSTVQPVLLVLDDLHWADEGTLSLITHLAPLIAKMPVLMVGTYRDFELRSARPLAKAVDELVRYHVLDQLSLSGLPKPAVAKMIEAIGGREPPEEVASLIYSETEGNPFFIEELLQHLIEQDQLLDMDGAFRQDLKLEELDVPRTVRLGIGRRVARLSDGAQKSIATAAVIGRAFTFELLRESSHADIDSLLDWIEEAEKAGLIGSTLQYPEVQFRFCHELIRQTVISEVSAVRQQRLHLEAAEAIERLYSDTLENYLGELAHHYRRGNNVPKALEYLERAGQQAGQRSAFRDALENYQKALTLLKLLPESPERDVREMGLLQHMTLMLWVTKGHSAPETVDTSQRAGTLAEKMGSLLQHWMWIIARCLGAFGSGDVLVANMLADQAFELAVREGSAFSHAGACTVQIIMRFWRGNLVGAEESFTTGRKFFGDPAFRQLPDGGVAAAFAYASGSAWILGRADVARKRIALMETSIENNLFDVALSKSLGANVCVLMREYTQAEELAAQAVELSEKHHILLIASSSRAALGYARARLGRAAEGVELIRQAIGNALDVGACFPGVTMYTTFLAEALEGSGAIAEALQTAEQALQVNPGELLYRPEIIRVRGELRLKLGQSELAEADFRDAIALARTMAGKIWELRSTTSLARLLTVQGRCDEGRAALAEIYNWFTEGFDTADLKEAKALLVELSR